MTDVLSGPVRPWLGIIADDFTGATDVAGYLVAGGLSVAQFFGVPSSAEPVETDCLVVALKSRSISPQDAVKVSLEALGWLQGQGVENVYFKYCSTFDSTARGNIGPVADAIAKKLGANEVLFSPSAPGNGRTTYQGRLFVGDDLLEESPLKDHPLNPMHESDLRIILGEQSSLPVGFVPLQTVQAGPDALEAALHALTAKGIRHVIADSITNDDLTSLGGAALVRPFSTGAAGLAAGMARARRQGQDLLPSSLPAVPTGRAAILSGSCSLATRGQVESWQRSHPSFLVDPRAIEAGEDVVARAIEFIDATPDGEVPLLYSSADPAEVAQVQEDLGVEHSAQLVEGALGAIARALIARGVRRLLVAGGETSGAVVSALDIVGVRIGAEVDPGVPWVTTLADEPIGLLLKSGNFGSVDLFQKALAGGDIDAIEAAKGHENK